jgi:hypothetical protein
MSATIVSGGRNLRILRRVASVRSANRTGSGSFWCIVCLLMMQFLVQGNVLRAMGIVVNIRVHPANILLVFVALYVLVRGRYSLHERLRDTPGLMLFVFAVPLFSLYTIYFNGISGAAFYWDSFWAPALMALCLQDATDKHKRILARLLFAIVMTNVLFGLYESLTQNNIFPFVALDDDVSKAAANLQPTVDFRANAFYPHPLTASLVTAMTLILMYRMQLPFLVLAPSFVLLLVGLLEFGGRTALAVAIVMTGIAAFWITLSGLLKRNLKLSTMVYMILAAIGIPILVTLVVTQTHIAERIMNTMYFDDSAAVRVLQWRVLDYLTLKNWLFGVSMEDLIRLKYRVGLNEVEDIENFWLLLFLNLGSVGYITFLCTFFLFLTYIARVGGGLFGWLLMLSGLIIDSSSNSLGQKTYDLLIEVVLLVAMSGFNGWMRPKSARFISPRSGGRLSGGKLGLSEAPQRLREPVLRTLRR